MTEEEMKGLAFGLVIIRNVRTGVEIIPYGIIGPILFSTEGLQYHSEPSDWEIIGPFPHV